MNCLRPFVYLLILCFSFSRSLGQIVVPSTLEYCGVEIQFTPEAQAVVQDYVDKIHQHPMYFEQMVMRARTYMPFIEEAFREARVPEDLKFICIQESGMQANAVSKSNAVGFWQFKEAVGQSVGLIINEKVDERRHIFRSSQAAAVYFTQTYTDFANWIYAIIAYYEGPTGAVKHTDPSYYGRNKMTIDENLHWYALKAIAHKLAYEEALGTYQVPDIFLTPYASEGETSVRELAEQHSISSQLFLEYNAWILDNRKLPKNIAFTYYVPRPGEYYTSHKEDPMKKTTGEVAVKEAPPEVTIEETSELSVVYTDISVLDDGSVMSDTPDGSPISTSSGSRDPQPSEDSVAQKPQESFFQPETPAGTEDIGVTPNDTTSYATDTFWTESEAMPAISDSLQGPALTLQEVAMNPAEVLRRDEYAQFYLKDDLHYGISFLLFEADMSIEEIATINRLNADKLLKWNGIYGTSTIPEGKIIYLLPPGQRGFHIVEQGESLAHIAARLDYSINKLITKNRLKDGELVLYEGQKLYLKKKRPKSEKLIILVADPEASEDVIHLASAEETFPTDPGVTPADTMTLVSSPTPAPSTTPTESESKPVIQVKTQWIEHTVKEGESLWNISQQYGTKVEIIKMINKLKGDEIQPGQILKILSREQ